MRVLSGARVRCARRYAAAHSAAQVPGRDVPALDTAAYDEASEEVMSLLRDFGHPVEVWGWDEAYVGADVDDPIQLAEQIREVVSAETGLSCSVGISDNKQRAKVATGFGKPAGIYQLTEVNWMAVMGDRDVDALWGVGPKTAKKLAGLGIATVADLAATDATLLTSTFGPTTGLWILLLAKGGGDTNVSAEPWVPRSRSHVITFPRDLTERAEIDSAVVDLARQTLAEIVGQGRVVTRVAVTVRTKTFFTRTKIRKLPSASTDADVITPRHLSFSICSNSTGRFGCSACGSNCAAGGRLLATTAPVTESLLCEISNLAHRLRFGGIHPHPDLDGRSARVNSTFACRIATLYGHHIVRLNM